MATIASVPPSKTASMFLAVLPTSGAIVNSQRRDWSAHWQNVYETKVDLETSWFQEEPTPSLELIQSLGTRRGSVIDIGGGTSTLGGRLAAIGFDATVLDISVAAIDRAKARVGGLAERMHWIHGDVTDTMDLGIFDIWHDRAVFHFLVGEADRQRYVALATRSVAFGGHLVIGAFARTGPDTCSGLPVERYDAGKIATEFASGFILVKSLEHTHVTPWGRSQPFCFVVLQRTAIAESAS